MEPSAVADGKNAKEMRDDEYVSASMEPSAVADGKNCPRLKRR